MARSTSRAPDDPDRVPEMISAAAAALAPTPTILTMPLVTVPVRSARR